VDHDSDEEQEPPREKPNGLLALDSVSTELFGLLKSWFDVGDTLTLDLTEIDSAVTEMSDPVRIAAMAMRKLQGLNLLSTPGVLTSTDVVVAIIQDLDRALVQAPSMYLSLRAENTDWDRALADLDSEPMVDAPSRSDDTDPEIERFQHLHAELHQALYEVVEVSEGQIRYFR